VLTPRESDLVAVSLPPGPAWADVLARAWRARAAVFPVDHRLPRPEVDRLLRAGRPTMVMTEHGNARLGDGDPVDPSVALVIATSGTAGQPKIAELTRDALQAAVTTSAERLGASPADEWLCCLPLAHMGGMLVALRGLLLGSPVTFQPRFDPAAFSQGAAGGAAFTSVVPAMLARALDADVPLRGFRGVLVGGAGLHEELATRALAAGARIVTTYGLTESCGGVVYDGEPLRGVELDIDQQGDGEVLLRGPTLFRGYRGDREATARAFTEGWLRTRDAGTIDNGKLRILGRLDDAILTGGEKVWPAEVEEVLRRDPSVREVAVTGRPDPVWGSRVVAYVVAADPASPPTAAGLRPLVERWLARHKAPREIVVVESLPTTGSGKIRAPDP
jgi:o-succinylbenzoate---CoA ligase